MSCECSPCIFRDQVVTLEDEVSRLEAERDRAMGEVVRLKSLTEGIEIRPIAPGVGAMPLTPAEQRAEAFADEAKQAARACERFARQAGDAVDSAGGPVVVACMGAIISVIAMIVTLVAA